ncbi:MAG TPA: UDP-N-acetylglucosamine diphosphorylase [Candidatus Ornithoclostridium excrementipullorum]|nr:UDP-N-acetylglucosamine diphosphorylase [Candidatus Ornithoclostridium excrementipullorum]
MSENVYISPESKIEDGAVVYPNNSILGASVIRKGAVVYPNCIIEDCDIGEGAEVTASVLRGAVVGKNTTVGPFAYMRKGSKIGEGCRIGDFVEIKNAEVGDGTKVAHLTYVGDCEIGKNCNIGCGVVFVNYDGKTKHRTSVGDRCFIGSNCNLIAPLEIGSGSYIAAGTTVTESVPPDGLVVGRSRQTVKHGKAQGRY